MRTYIFKVVVEPDEDRWHAYCPVLEDKGGATWGYTREEALKNISEVVEMIIEELIEDGEPIPEAPEEEVQVFSEPRAMVIVSCETALSRDGFYLRSQRGSHQRYYHPDGRKVTVSFHSPGDTFPPKTLKKMIEKQAKWTEHDLKLLNILK